MQTSIKNTMGNELELLGKRIAKLRISRNLTQEKLAELVERSPNHISKLELAAANPSFQLLVKIAHVLNVEMYSLFQFEEKTNTENVKHELENFINSDNTSSINLLYKIYRAIES